MQCTGETGEQNNEAIVRRAQRENAKSSAWKGVNEN